MAMEPTRRIAIAISLRKKATLPQETRAKIDKAFQQLFHGDGQEERVYFETGANENGTLAYITDWANNDARTEGMSYGMMIAVELNKKREFDAHLELVEDVHAHHRPEEPFGRILRLVDEYRWHSALDRGRP